MSSISNSAIQWHCCRRPAGSWTNISHTHDGIERGKCVERSYSSRLCTWTWVLFGVTDWYDGYWAGNCMTVQVVGFHECCCCCCEEATITDESWQWSHNSVTSVWHDWCHIHSGPYWPVRYCLRHILCTVWLMLGWSKCQYQTGILAWFK